MNMQYFIQKKVNINLNKFFCFIQAAGLRRQSG